MAPPGATIGGVPDPLPVAPPVAGRFLVLRHLLALPGALPGDLPDRRHLLFEALNRGPSILPTRERPWDRHAARQGEGTFVEPAEQVDIVLARPRAGGPPIRTGGRPVGRVEPRIDRNARRVRILGACWKPAVDPPAEPGFVPALAAALAGQATFAGAGAAT